MRWGSKTTRPDRKPTLRGIKPTLREQTPRAVEDMCKQPIVQNLPTAQILGQPTTPGNSTTNSWPSSKDSGKHPNSSSAHNVNKPNGSTPTTPRGNRRRCEIGSKPANPNRGTPNNHVRSSSASNPGKLPSAKRLASNRKPMKSAAPTDRVAFLDLDGRRMPYAPALRS